MLEILKLLVKERSESPQTGFDAKTISIDEIQDELRACILEVLSAARIDRSVFHLDLHVKGPLKDGRHLVAANLRLVKWERMSGLRLLVGLPILERGCRRAIGASWVDESAHFGGLWLHPSGGILERAMLKELGRDLSLLEKAGPYLHMDDSSASVAEIDRKATDWGTLS